MKRTSAKALNNRLRAMAAFCADRGVPLVPMPVEVLAEYTELATRRSVRPRSLLSLIATVVNLVHDALHEPSPARHHLFERLRKAVQLTRTTQPVQRGIPVPAELIAHVLHAWGANDTMPLERLRAKLCALLGFVGLCRPSDITLPRAGQVAVAPAHDCLVICMLGFKNDYQAKGASVRIWRASDALLDPVECYLAWMRRTDAMRPADPAERARWPVVIKLREPHDGLTAATVCRILNEFIVAGGGDRSLMSARCFRRGGASLAIAREVMPDKVLKLGRWASERVFRQHYVQTSVDRDFTDILLCNGPTRPEGPVLRGAAEPLRASPPCAAISAADAAGGGGASEPDAAATGRALVPCRAVSNSRGGNAPLRARPSRGRRAALLRRVARTKRARRDMTSSSSSNSRDSSPSAGCSRSASPACSSVSRSSASSLSSSDSVQVL